MTEVVRLKYGVSGADIATGIRPEHLETEPGPTRAAAPRLKKPKKVLDVRAATRFVRRMNLVGDWDDTATAAVLLLGATQVGTDVDALTEWSSYNPGLVKLVADRLRENGIWLPDRTLAYFSTDEPLEQDVEFTLCAMAGAGLVVRGEG